MRPAASVVYTPTGSALRVECQFVLPPRVQQLMETLMWGRRPELNSEKWCGSWRMYWPDGTALPLPN
jgi:hypothetical protein